MSKRYFIEGKANNCSSNDQKPMKFGRKNSFLALSTSDLNSSNPKVGGKLTGPQTSWVRPFKDLDHSFPLRDPTEWSHPKRFHKNPIRRRNCVSFTPIWATYYRIKLPCVQLHLEQGFLRSWKCLQKNPVTGSSSALSAVKYFRDGPSPKLISPALSFPSPTPRSHTDNKCLLIV